MISSRYPLKNKVTCFPIIEIVTHLSTSIQIQEERALSGQLILPHLAVSYINMHTFNNVYITCQYPFPSRYVASPFSFNKCQHCSANVCLTQQRCLSCQTDILKLNVIHAACPRSPHFIQI